MKFNDNKVVLEHTGEFVCLQIIYGCFPVGGQDLTVAIGTVPPAKAKIFTIWLFTQKVCPALKQT